jgi:hypothetical protein
MESAIFAATFVAFLVPIAVTIAKPLPFQISATKYAQRAGWNYPTILVTRCLPFLTLYTQFCALYSHNAAVST